MEDLYVKLLQSSIRFVSFRPRSEKEIRSFLLKKLQKHKIEDNGLLERIITRLRELDYINDEKFAAWWIDQRKSHKPKGKRLISQELKAKGVTIEISPSDEVELARRAVAKKLLLWQKLPKLEQKKKIYGFLGRRGFTGDTIHRVIDGVLDNEIES